MDWLVFLRLSFVHTDFRFYGGFVHSLLIFVREDFRFCRGFVNSLLIFDREDFPISIGFVGFLRLSLSTLAFLSVLQL